MNTSQQTFPLNEAPFMARSQVLNKADNFNAVITAPAWKSKPSWMAWYADARQSNQSDLERWYATRANSRKIEISQARAKRTPV